MVLRATRVATFAQARTGGRGRGVHVQPVNNGRYAPELEKHCLISCGCLLFTKMSLKCNNGSDGISTWSKLDVHTYKQYPDHFISNFDSNNMCSFYYLCPCPWCSNNPVNMHFNHSLV